MSANTMAAEIQELEDADDRLTVWPMASAAKALDTDVDMLIPWSQD